MAGPWGAIAGSLASIGGNILSSAFNKSENESQNNWNPYASIAQAAINSTQWRGDTKWYNDNIVAHSYKRARESLQEAGYNPLMALQYGGLYDQAPINGAPQTKSSAHEISNGYSISRMTDTQVDNTKADTMLKGAQTDYTSALATSEGIKQIGYQTDNLIKESEKVIADSNAKYRDKKNAYEIKSMATQIEKNIAEIGLIDTQKKVNSAQEELFRTNNAIQKGQQKYQEEHPILYNIGKASGDILPGAGAIGAIGAYGYHKYKTRKKPIGFK